MAHLTVALAPSASCALFSAASLAATAIDALCTVEESCTRKASSSAVPASCFGGGGGGDESGG